jgi:hypothetical protein
VSTEASPKLRSIRDQDTDCNRMALPVGNFQNAL